MHREVTLYKIMCPECGTAHYGFVGDNEDGNFYCNTKIEIKRGKKESIEECGYYSEKIRHLPEGNFEKIASVKIKESKPNIEYYK